MREDNITQTQDGEAPHQLIRKGDSIERWGREWNAFAHKRKSAAKTGFYGKYGKHVKFFS